MPKSVLKNILILSLFMIYLLVGSITVHAADTYEDIKLKTNHEINVLYGLENYYGDLDVNQLRAINQQLVLGNWAGITHVKDDVYSFGGRIFKAFIYGEEHDFNGVIDAISNHFAGYTRNGDQFSNLYHPIDPHTNPPTKVASGAPKKIFLGETNWIPSPWLDSKIKQDYHLKPSPFDQTMSLAASLKIQKSIIGALDLSFIDFTIDKNQFSNINWQEYIHILQPPTMETWGMGMIWTKSYSYKTILMEPFEESTLDNIKAEILVAPPEAQADSRVYLDGLATCKDENQVPVPITTTGGWFTRVLPGGNENNAGNFMPIVVNTDSFYLNNGSRKSSYSFVMPTNPGDVLEVKFAVNINKDQPFKEYPMGSGFLDNEASVKITATQSLDIPVGKIKFSPEYSDWRNTDISVKVYVEGDKSTKVQENATRTYTYITSSLTCNDPEHLLHTSSCWTTSTAVGQKMWPFTQSWNVNTLGVTGNGLVTSPSSVQDEGSVVVSKEGVSRLDGQVNQWSPGYKSWSPGTIQGSWTSGNPPDTAPPTERYESNSREYKIDKTLPILTIDWSKRDFVKNGLNQYIYLPDNKINFYIRDDLSGIEEVKYLWNHEVTAPDAAVMKQLGIQTAERKDGFSETIYATVNVHDDMQRLGAWNLHVYVRDRAGNVRRTVEKVEIIAYLEALNIKAISDPQWSDATFPIGVSSMPVTLHKSKNYIAKKGYEFYFQMTGKGLNQDSDCVKITPRFFYLQDLSDNGIKNSFEIDIYYNLGNNYYIQVGDTKRDTYQLQYNKLFPIGSLSSLALDGNVRMINDPKTSTWYGSYKLMPDSVAVKKGVSIWKGGKLDESVLLKKGIILINFELDAYKGNTKMFSYIPDQWSLEGGPTGNLPYLFYPGDLIIFDNANSSLSDIGTGTNH